MGIEVKIEISIGYIAIWENLTQKKKWEMEVRSEPNMALGQHEFKDQILV